MTNIHTFSQRPRQASLSLSLCGCHCVLALTLTTRPPSMAFSFPVSCCYWYMIITLSSHLTAKWQKFVWIIGRICIFQDPFLFRCLRWVANRKGRTKFVHEMGVQYTGTSMCWPICTLLFTFCYLLAMDDFRTWRSCHLRFCPKQRDHRYWVV